MAAPDVVSKMEDELGLGFQPTSGAPSPAEAIVVDGGAEEITPQAFPEAKNGDGNTSSLKDSQALEVLTGETEKTVNADVVEEEAKGGGDDGKNAEERKEEMTVPLFPVRPGKIDCSYYMKTGTCAYEAKCVYNHPSRNDMNSVELSGKLRLQSEISTITVNASLGNLSLDEKNEEKPPPFSSLESVEVVNSDGWDDWKDENDWRNESVIQKSGWDDEENGDKGLVVFKDDEGKDKTQALYPQRSGRNDCTYYMKNGMCAYGTNCKFNHPPRANETQAADRSWSEVNLEGGQRECKYYLLPGGCKYGKACKYDHTREKSEEQAMMFNFLGLPLRPGQKECPYYMQTGACKFSSNCWYNHPDPSAVSGQNSVPNHQNSGPFQQPIWMSSVPPPSFFQQTQNERPSLLAASQSSYLTSIPFPPIIHHTKPRFNDHPQLQGDFPERPGQLECPHFMKTGECKFKSACKFHHPRSRLPKTLACSLSPCGLPLRPDQPVCSFYSRFGICKFGPACKFNHPTDLDPSGSAPERSFGGMMPLGNGKTQGFRMGDRNTSVQQSA